MGTIEPVPVKSFDWIAESYDQTRFIPPEPLATVTAAIAGVLREVAGDPRLLEAGVGTGRLAVPLTQEGISVTGIDISPAMLGVLRRKRRDIEVLLADAARPPFRPAAFDGLLFVHVLHLVPDVEAVVRALLPLVREQGVVLQGWDHSGPAVRADASTLIREAAVAVAGYEHPQWRAWERTRDTYHRLLEEAGYRVETVRLADWPATVTGRDLLTGLSERRHSQYKWAIPEADLPEVVRRAEAGLRHLFGDLDRVVEGESSFHLAIGRRGR